MVYIWIILAILFIVLFFIFFSSAEIHIKNVEYFTEKVQNKNINQNYEIILRIKLFDKITFLKLNLKKNNFKNIKKALNTKKIKEKLSKNNLNTGILKLTKYWKIQNIDLRVKIGLEDAALNAITVGIIATIISIILRKFVESKSNALWKIEPTYNNQNLLKIYIDAILCIKFKDLLLNKEKGAKIDGKSIIKNRTLNWKNRSRKTK